ncbi:MAG: septal ring lytic transglycosylase RlpA family protein [Coleofasciculus sp. G1-WW12-02]|uniref:septal ring lytic transglycosylase RlpA family protein n=1 Tax=Coleofasciculus sp. G1-WW12-02 TaxID=3068483 RepID=UPI0033033F69
MNQRILSGLTVTFLTTALSTVISNPANQAQAVDQGSEGNLTPAQALQSPETIPSTSSQPTLQPPEVVKVGEFQSPASQVGEAEEVIAKIHGYSLDGRQAATLYVRDIPVLTFLGSKAIVNNGSKVGEVALGNNSEPGYSSSKTVSDYQSLEVDQLDNTASPSVTSTSNANLDDAVWRATAVAAQLNQLHRDNINADAIAVRWNEGCNCYSIKVNDQELVQVNENTILPDTTQNLAEDALQATNRLRRLMGNAPPIREIEGKPTAQTIAQVAIGSVRFQVKGIASWYGPGFHGNRSASGERFNQNALTAAHRSLPFGTNVRVTNLNNGRSVIVRINDRGPYARGRVIDLSAAAARVLGLLRTGVAPVQIEVLDNY